MGKVFQRYNSYHAKQKSLFSFVFHAEFFFHDHIREKNFPSLDAAGVRFQKVLEVLIFLPLVLVTKQTKEGREEKERREKRKPTCQADMWPREDVIAG